MQGGGLAPALPLLYIMYIRGEWAEKRTIGVSVVRTMFFLAIQSVWTFIWVGDTCTQWTKTEGCMGGKVT